MQFRQIWESQRELRLARRVRPIADDRLDVLVLNAGISKAALIADHRVEDFNNLFATNVRGPFFSGAATFAVLGEERLLTPLPKEH